MTRIFLHGLESSSKGAKSSFLRTLFPDMLIPDFKGSLSERMAYLEVILAGMENIIMVGSSFGGLMATIYAMERQESVDRLVLLAPALNFPEFSQYKVKSIKVPTRVIIGSDDNVTPVQEVLPLARKIFVDLNYDEESHEEGAVDIPVAMIPSTGEITLLQLDGGITKKQVIEAIEFGKPAFDKMAEEMRAALHARFKE